MNAQTTLATGVLAALSLSPLLAQRQQTPSADPKPYYQYQQDAGPAAPPRALSLPPVMHICFGGCSAGKGGALLLENGHYVMRDAQGVANLYEVVKFTPESVVFKRTDYRPRPASAMLTGRISADGTSIIDGKIMWPGAAAPNPFQMAWGAAINSVPGTSPQPNQQIAQQPGMQQAQQALQMAMQELNPGGAQVNANPAALWGALLGSLAEDAVSGDLTDRITSLQRAESDARERCNRARPIEGGACQ